MTAIKEIIAAAIGKSKIKADMIPKATEIMAKIIDKIIIANGFLA